jgi:hypothetical protein
MTHTSVAEQVAELRRLQRASLAKADQCADGDYLEHVYRTEAVTRGTEADLLAKSAARPPTLTKAEQAMIASAVEAGTAELRRGIARTEAEITRLTPAPTPVLTRRAPRPGREAEAADLLAKAEAVRRDDPIAAAGYRDRANELLKRG